MRDVLLEMGPVDDHRSCDVGCTLAKKGMEA